MFGVIFGAFCITLAWTGRLGAFFNGSRANRVSRDGDLVPKSAWSAILFDTEYFHTNHPGSGFRLFAVFDMKPFCMNPISCFVPGGLLKVGLLAG